MKIKKRNKKMIANVITRVRMKKEKENNTREDKTINDNNKSNATKTPKETEQKENDKRNAANKINKTQKKIQ